MKNTPSYYIVLLILVNLCRLGEASVSTKFLNSFTFDNSASFLNVINQKTGASYGFPLDLATDENLMDGISAMDSTGTTLAFATRNSTNWVHLYTNAVESKHMSSHLKHILGVADILAIEWSSESHIVGIVRLHRDSPLQIVSVKTDADNTPRIVYTFDNDIDVIERTSTFDPAYHLLFTVVKRENIEMLAINVTSGELLSPSLPLSHVPVTIDVDSTTRAMYMALPDGRNDSMSLSVWDTKSSSLQSTSIRVHGNAIQESVSAFDSANSTLFGISISDQSTQQLVSTSVTSSLYTVVPFNNRVISLSLSDRAAVENVSPLVGPSSGGTVLTISGRHFRDTSLTKCVFGEIHVTPLQILNSTTATCTSPLLQANVPVRVSISNDGSQNDLSTVFFSPYIGLSVSQVTPNSGFVSGNVTVVITGTAFSDTEFLLCRFGIQNVAATYVSSTEVSCVAPSSSVAGPVSVEITLNQQHYTSNNVQFLYKCPDGDYCNGDGTACVPCPPSFECPFPNNSTIQQCRPGMHSKGRQIHCTPCEAGFACPDPFGNNIVECWHGSYSSKGQPSCTVCPSGSACPSTDKPVENPCAFGHYSLGNTTSCTMCPPGRSCPDPKGLDIKACVAGSYSSGGQSQCSSCPRGSMCAASSSTPITCPKGTFNNVTGMAICTPCLRPDRCIGGSNCLTAYTGVSCLDCSKGHFRFGGDCLECSAVPVPAFVLFGLALIVVFVIYKSGLDFKRVTQLKIFFNQLQIMLVAISLSIPFPITFLEFLDFLAVINLNIDMASPECYIDEWTWYHEFYIGVALSIFLLLLTESIRFVALQLQKRNAARPNKTLDLEKDTKLGNVANGARRLLVLFISVVYVPLTKSFMRVFDCRDDGVLRVDPKLVCSGSMYTIAAIIGGIGLMLITVGLPLFVLLFMTHLLRRNSKEKQQDSKDVLGGEFHLLDHGDIRGKYGVLYESFKKQFAYFEGTVMIRKALLIVFTTFLSTIPTVQALLVVVVNTLFLFVSLRWRPYAPLLRTIGPVRLDILNAMEICGNMLGVVNGIVATMLAFKVNIPSIASTAILISTFCLAIVILTGLAATSKRKLKLFKSRKDEPREMVEKIKEQIKEYLESGQYDEADEHLFMLNKIRGRRIAELNRMRGIRVERMQDVREIDDEIAFYQPPEVITTDDIKLSVAETGLPGIESFDFDSVSKIEIGIDKLVEEGTLVTVEGFKKCTELRTKALEWIESHESALQEACDLEKYILAKKISLNLQRLKSIVSYKAESISEPDSSTGQTRRRRTFTAAMRQSIPLAVLHRKSNISWSSIALLDIEGCWKLENEVMKDLNEEARLLKSQIDSVIQDREYEKCIVLFKSKIEPMAGRAKSDIGYLLKRLLLLGEDEDKIKAEWDNLEEHVLFLCEPMQNNILKPSNGGEEPDLFVLEQELSRCKENVKKATDVKDYDKAETARSEFLKYATSFVDDCEALEKWYTKKNEFGEASRMRECGSKAVVLKQLYE